ncbi:MAG: glutamine amidotransferase [Proteobacteria bacterium]|nr:glutamine amidotransferase [Pseudomonadota bacterium]
MTARSLVRPDSRISGPARPTVRRRSNERAARPTDILVVLHQEHSTPGRVGRLLQERGFRLDIRRPRFGDPLPTDTSHLAGAVIFGGPMSANDPDDFVKAETDWIGVALKDELPFLGICLGAQMLARHLGGKVYFHPEGHVEVGYYPLYPTETALGELPWPDHVYQWHREGFDVPAGAELLATGDCFRNQAIRVGRAAYGIQFHPEVTHWMMNRWTTRAHERMASPNARSRQEHFDGRFMHDPAVRVWLDSFLDHWTGLKVA